LIAEPSLNLTAAGQGCCIEPIECVLDASWAKNAWFAIGNGGATAVLMLTVLFTSWLYISLNATKANKSRWPEARVLVKRLRQEFLILHVLFIVGITLAYLGMYSVMCAKVTHRSLSWVVFSQMLASGVVAGLLFFKCLWEIHQVNVAVEKLRDFATSEEKEMDQTSRSSSSLPLRSGRSSADSDLDVEDAES